MKRQLSELEEIIANKATDKRIHLKNIQAAHEEKAMAPHSSILAWRIPETEEPNGLPSMGPHRVGHD